MSHEPHLSPIDEIEDDDIDTYDQSQIRFGLMNETGSETESLIQRRPKPKRARSTPSSGNSSINKKQHRLKRSKSSGYESVSSDNSNDIAIQNRPRLSRQLSRFGPTLFRAQSLLQDIVLPDPSPLPLGQYDVAEAIDLMGMGKFQWILFIIIGLIFSAYAIEVMLVAFLLPILQKEFEISALQSTLVPLSSIIGSFIGAFILSLLADKFGRRKIIIIGVIMTAISGIISAYAEDIYFESVARFFVGFFMKIGVVAITLLAEFLPSKYRWKILVLTQIWWTLGLMASVSLAWISLTYFDWRFYVKLSTIPLWIAAIGTCWMPESAHYLITAGKYNDCLKILKKISKYNGRNIPNGTLIMPPEMKRGDIGELFNGKTVNGLTSILLLFIYVSYQSVYYGIVFISVRYFAKLDSIYELHHELYWEMMLTTFSEIPGIIIGFYIIDWERHFNADTFGRKLTINIGFAAFTLSTYLLVFIDFEWSREFGIAILFISRLWITICGLAAGVYFLEYYPTHIRATALGFAVSISMILKFAAIIIAETLHIMIAMYIFGSIGVFAFISSLMLPSLPKKWKLED